MKKYSLFLIFTAAISIASIYGEPSPPVITKWFNNFRGAISLTYDHGDPQQPKNRDINKFIASCGLSMDYEIVTYDYQRNETLVKYLHKHLIPMGFGYFGHGHKHLYHDNLSYDDALKSFKHCYDAMIELKLKPIAYAYPSGAGNKPQTRKALEAAGFLCGRLHFSDKKKKPPYIVPSSQTEPEDWFALPALVMQDYSFKECKHCVGTNDQLIEYLDETIKQEAWIILAYHSIGDERGYGFIKYDEFEKNINSIKERPLWNAPMSAVTLYIRERAHAQVKVEPVYHRKKEISYIEVTLSDNLPNDIYDQPLTIIFSIPPDWVNHTINLVEQNKVIKTFLFESQQAMISLPPDEIEKKLTPRSQ